MITVVSWNIDGRLQAVEELLAMDADVALLQEVGLGALETLRQRRKRRGQPPGSLGTLDPGALRFLAHGGEALRPGGGAVVQAGPAHHAPGG